MGEVRSEPRGRPGQEGSRQEPEEGVSLAYLGEEGQEQGQFREEEGSCGIVVRAASCALTQLGDAGRHEQKDTS